MSKPKDQADDTPTPSYSASYSQSLHYAYAELARKSVEQVKGRKNLIEEVGLRVRALLDRRRYFLHVCTTLCQTCFSHVQAHTFA